MKKSLLILNLIACSAFGDFSETIYNYIPDALSSGAKSGATMLLGLKKQHNIHISADEHTLAFLLLLNREQVGLTKKEAKAIKKKLMQYILADKTRPADADALPTVVPATDAETTPSA